MRKVAKRRFMVRRVNYMPADGRHWCVDDHQEGQVAGNAGEFRGVVLVIERLQAALRLADSVIVALLRSPSSHADDAACRQRAHDDLELIRQVLDGESEPEVTSHPAPRSLHR